MTTTTTCTVCMATTTSSVSVGTTTCRAEATTTGYTAEPATRDCWTVGWEMTTSTAMPEVIATSSQPETTGSTQVLVQQRHVLRLRALFWRGISRKRPA